MLQRPGRSPLFLPTACHVSALAGFYDRQKKIGENIGYVSLVAFWMCFEYIHLQDWGLSWPWLTLGNAFATHPEWVEWYEFTGTSGGTLWVLLMNIFLFLHQK